MCWTYPNAQKHIDSIGACHITNGCICILILDSCYLTGKCVWMKREREKKELKIRFVIGHKVTGDRCYNLSCSS